MHYTHHHPSPLTTAFKPLHIALMTMLIIFLFAFPILVSTKYSSVQQVMYCGCCCHFPTSVTNRLP